MVDNLNKKMAIGYWWNLTTKWITRSIGIISTLILIRLLTPADFGIATLASIVIALFMMLSQVGTEKYVIKTKECNDDLLNSAWSLNIVLKILCGLIIAGSANAVSQYIHEPVLKNVLLLCSLIPIIGSLKNIGLIYYEKELNYKPLTRLAVGVKLIVFPITIGLAFWLQNYWALVVGSVMTEVLTVIGSYLLHPYRPHWSSKQWNVQWHFSKWMLISTTTGYIRSRIDALLLGRFLPSDSVGIYRISQEFAWLPFSEFIAPATSSFYAGISRISQNRDELCDKIIGYQTVAYLLVIPATLGIYALQDQIVAVVMGEQWISSSPVIGWLSILMLSMPLNMALQTVLINLSKVKFLVVIDLIMIALITFSFSLLHQEQIYSLQTYTMVRVMLVVVFILLLLTMYKLLLGMSLKRLLTVCFMPVFPSGVMFVAIERLEELLNYSQPVNLMILTVSGTLIFIPLMFVLIMFARKRIPDYQASYELIINMLVLIKKKISTR